MAHRFILHFNRPTGEKSWKLTCGDIARVLASRIPQEKNTDIIFPPRPTLVANGRDDSDDSDDSDNSNDVDDIDDNDDNVNEDRAGKNDRDRHKIRNGPHARDGPTDRAARPVRDGRGRFKHHAKAPAPAPAPAPVPAQMPAPVAVPPPEYFAVLDSPDRAPDPSDVYNMDLWDVVGLLQWQFRCDAVISIGQVRKRFDDIRYDMKHVALSNAISRLGKGLTLVYPHLATLSKHELVQLIAFGFEMATAVGASPDLMEFAKSQVQAIDLVSFLHV